jgi:hypothetical protein
MPPTNPETTQIMFSRRRSMFFRSGMPSMIMLLPREIIRASKPHEKAPATAEESATLQAMFENGISLVNSQV